MSKDHKKKRFSWISLILYIVLGLLFIYLMRGRFEQFFADKKIKNINITNLMMTDTNGAVWSISDLENRAVLLVFWASWCGPCRMEIPHLNKLSAAYPEDLLILGINSGESMSVIESAVSDHSIMYPVVSDMDGSLSKLFNVKVLPTMVAVNRKGKISSISHGYNPLISSKVKKLLKK